MSGIVTTEIGSLRPFMKSLTLQCIVLHVEESPKATKDGREIFEMRVADNTGSIELLLWDEDGRHIRPGDILQIVSGYVTLFKNRLRLYVSKFGKVKRVGEFTMGFAEEPNISEIQWNLEELGLPAKTGSAHQNNA